MERVVRKLQAESGALRCFVFDFECVHEISDAAARILCELLADAARAQLAFSCVGLARHARLARSLGEAVAAGELPHFAQHADLDAALEWCEQRLLGDGATSAAQAELALEQHEALAALEPEDLRAVAALAERRELAPRQIVVREGDPADEVFLLVAGRLSVLASSPDGQLHRLATLSPGMSFGESALAQRGTRTALVRADEPSVCWALRRDALEAASRERPRLMTALLGSLLRSAIAVSARLTRELAAARSVQGFPPE
jgi:glutaminase